MLPLAALLALSLVVGSILSVDPRLSWLGSYPRFQGAWTQLSYLLIFSLTLAHLRTRAQWRRAAYAMILASLPVALYAILQALGFDPVPNTVGSRRAYSTLGNPIFLGAYVLMVAFVTLFELGRTVTALAQRETLPSSRRLTGQLPALLRALALSTILICQLAALVLSQSRGPFLGLLAGAYVFFLVLALAVRGWVQNAPQLSHWLGGFLRWAWLVIIGLGLLGVTFLITFSLPDSPLTPLRQVPYLGRLGTILDFESNTVQVRLLIWEGVVDLMRSNEPLTPPGGEPDALRPLRPLIGYGPETLFLAFNRYFPPELGQREGRSDIPDRAHNETFDALVMNGILGYVIWLGIYCGVFYLALRRLRLVRTRAQRFSFWINLGLGAVLGALAPYYLMGEWTLSGVGLPAGMMMGLVVFVTLEALIDKSFRSANQLPNFRSGLIVALLATFIAHVVEIHFGIAIVSTRLYFWFLLALLVVVAQGWLQEQEPRSEPTHQKIEPRAERRRKRKKPQPEIQRPPAPDRRQLVVGVVAGLLWVIGAASLVFGMMLNQDKLRQTGAILAEAMFRSRGGSPLMGPLLWLVLASLLAAALLAPGLLPQRQRRSPKDLILTIVISSISFLTLYAVLQARRISRVLALQDGGSEIVDVVEKVAGHFSTFTWFCLALTLVIGTLLGRQTGDLRLWSRRQPAASAAAGLILTVATGWLVFQVNSSPIRADTLLKHARTFTAAGKPEVANRLLTRACELGPREPMNFLFKGQAAVEAARRAEDPRRRVEYFDAAAAGLLQARELAPLDPDHTANLARYLVRRSDTLDDREQQRDLQLQAKNEYAAALELRPNSVLLMNEQGLLLLRLKELDAAEKLLQRALEMDPKYPITYLRLAAVHQTRASEAQNTGDRVAFIDSLARAVAMYERALILKPGLDAAKGLERLQPALMQLAKAPPSAARLRELYGEDSEVHLAMARRHLDADRPDRALLHANLALELAEESERAAALETLAAVKAAAASVTPDEPKF
jgi:tetratricopeptide (TPR) repeat protein